MRLFVFGNGNLVFEDFMSLYAEALGDAESLCTTSYLVCDFRGADTLAMEYLKHRASRVRVFHVGERPRYLPDRYRTLVSQWELVGGFGSDEERDRAAIAASTHFLAHDFNSTETRKSGTQRNIEDCLRLGKVRIGRR